MLLFLPILNELDCINGDGQILGRIRFDLTLDKYTFDPTDESVVLTNIEEAHIIERLSGLASGKYAMPMHDDD